MITKYYFGVDVGTNSVRAGLFDNIGQLIDFQTKHIDVFNFKPNFYEQSSDQIWDAVIECLKRIILNCKPTIDINQIASIGFDATCSLVVLDENFNPVSVSPSNDQSINVIMWMDHRAKQEADLINSTNYERLDVVGGKISIEMDPPKILWLKRNLNDSCYSKVAHFFSLPDYLVWRSTNVGVRSVCTTGCKWLLISDFNQAKWDENFFKLIGLDDVLFYNKIGKEIKKPFEFVENLKISNELREKLGLNENTKVGISMIDAHAGGIGALALTKGYMAAKNIERKLEEILVVVSGTSTCLMFSSVERKFIQGIWGPYHNAMVPDMWLNEAGQSAAGKLIEFMVQTHPSYEILLKISSEKNQDSIYETLNDFLQKLSVEKKVSNMCYLTKDIHVYPDFHGNRSPLSDPNMLGQICGLDLDTGLESLALRYLATLQSLAYQTKQIIETMNVQSELKCMTIIGGLGLNKLYCQIQSDVCRIEVLVPKNSDSAVLFGSAILGASNCKDYKMSTFDDLIRNFSSLNSEFTKGDLFIPNRNIQEYHSKKYQVYLAMLDNQINYKKIMSI